MIEDSPALDGENYYRLYRRFWPLAAARSIHRVDRERGHPGSASETEPFNQYLYEISAGITALDYILDLQSFQAATRCFGCWFADNGYDAWLTPTLGMPPPQLGFFDAAAHGSATVLDRFIEFLPFTPFANMTGQPAVSLPLAWNAEGLPVGVQFFGRFGDETTLFQLAGELEQAQPWAQKRPQVYAGK